MGIHHNALIRMLLTLAVSAVLLAGTACGGDDDKKGAVSPTPTPTPSRPDPKQLLNDAADRLEKTNSFHWLLEHERGYTPIVLNLQMTRAEGDVVRPDRLRADVDAQLRGVKANVKLLSIGNSAKISNPFVPSQWQDLPTGTKLSDVFDPAAGTTAAVRSVKDPQITGEETIGGKKVWKVEGTLDAASLSALATIAEAGYTVKGTAWIGQDQPDIHRIRLEGPLGKQDAPDVVRVLTLTRFNENIQITPVP